MSRKLMRLVAGLALVAGLLAVPVAWAHKTVTAGGYAIEYGWLNEPPTAGQDNAVIINISGKADEQGHSEQSGAISVVEPADGGTVQGDSFKVTVMIEGVDAQAEGVHWHLSIDDQMVAMNALAQTSATVSHLSNGAHTLTVTLADANHVDFGEPATAKITVEGATASGELSASGTEASPEHGHGEEATAAPADEHSHDEAAGLNVDVSGLKLELVYGGQTTPLTLQPLKDGGAGQFVAPFKPERAGLYTLKITGKLTGDFGETDVNVEVQPEEITPSEAAPSATPSSNLPTWLIIGGIVVVVAAGLGIFAFTRRK